jgi:hypothetical protein
MSAADQALASLIERHLEGGLDARGRAELAELLRADPNARRLLSQQLDLSNLLAEEFSGEDFVSATVDRVLATRASAAPREVDPARAASARYRRSPSLRRPGRRRIIDGAAFFQRLGVAAASLALLAGGAWAMVAQRQAPVEVVATATDGDGTLLRSGRELPLSAGTDLAAGDEVHAAGATAIGARYADGTRVRLRPGAVAALQPADEPADGKHLRLMRGTLEAEVAKQPPGAPMEIASADATATVLGTSLTFAAREDGTRLEVAHGEVRLTRAADGASIVVRSGEYGEVAAASEFRSRPLGAPVVAAAKPEPAPKPSTPTATARKTVLLLRKNPGDDSAVERHLRGMGYDVVVVNDAESRTADANGKDLVIIPESVLARNVGTKFRDVAVPVITWEGGLFADMGLGRPGTMLENSGVLVIQDPDNPLAAGLKGHVRFASQPVNATTMRTRPSKAHVVAALESSPKDVAVFSYDAGQEMEEGMKAPAKRVGFFLHDNAEKYLTAEGWSLFDAAVRWCLKEPGK